MKKITLLALAAALTTSSCLTMQGLKKPLVMVDAPKDLIVNHNGDDLEVKDVTAFREEFGGTVTYYKYPGVKVKMKKNVVLDLRSGNKKGTAKIQTKPAVGLLIIEGIFTLGLGTVVDLATGAYRIPKSRFVDAHEILRNEKPRGEKELKSQVRSSYR